MKIRSPFTSIRAYNFKYYRRAFIVLLLLAFSVTLVLIASAQTKRQRKGVARRPTSERQNKKPGVRAERPGENEPVEEDVEGRENWFWHQRMYPFDELPENGREKAWASRPIDKNIRPEVLTWQPLGPISTTHGFVAQWGTTSGRISAIAISPTNANLVLIGSPTGGIWRSSDGGANFTAVADNLTDVSIGSIAFAPSNPAIVYAGAGDNNNHPYFGQGVLKSTDGGVTWAKISGATLSGPGVIRQVAVDPGDPTLIYAVQYITKNTTSNGNVASGFWRSTDGGVTWTRTLSGLFRNMAIRPGTPQTLYLGVNRKDTAPAGPAGVYRSTDGGATWNLVHTAPFDTTQDVRVAVTPAAPATVYVYEGGTDNTATRQVVVEVSIDGGTTWSTRGNRTDIDKGQFAYNTFIGVSPANANTIIIGSRDLFRSTDGGLNFNNIVGNFAAPNFTAYTPDQATTHSDQQTIAFSPTDANTILFGNDGGLFKSTNGGTTLTSLNATLSLTQFVGYAIDPTNATRSYGGTQDNGNQRRVAGTSQWAEIVGGDGGNTVVDQVTPGTVYVTYIEGSVTRYTNFGQNFDQEIGTNVIFGEAANGPRIAFYPPFTGNGVDAKLYFGSWKLFTSIDRGNTWAPTSADDLTGGGGDTLSAIGVARSNTNVIYTGSGQGTANVSTNGGTSWTNIPTGLPNRAITSITVSRTDPATAFLTVSGFGSGHVFRTTNTGGTWTDISNNLPNIPTNCLLIDPQIATELYVGTDIGVFRSIDNGATWATFNNGMPSVVVMKLVNSGNTIQAGTYGRGAYQLNDIGSQPTVQFSAANFAVTEGTTSTNFTISRSGDSSGTSTVNYATSNGTAKEGKDYVAALGSVIFGPGEITKNVQVLIIDNAFVDGSRTVNLALSGATNSTAGAPSTATVTIGDNDTVQGPNPLDTPRSFVQLHYYDFLNRLPDQSGSDFWTNQMTNCGNADLLVCRVNVSAAFFLSIEFQQTGYLVERFYKVGYGDVNGNSTLGGTAHTLTVPVVRFNEFLQDTQRIGRGVVVGQAGWETVLENNKAAYASEFVATTRFITAFPTSMTPTAFVNQLDTRAGTVLTPAQRTTAINLFGGAADTTNTAARAQAVRQVAENPTLNTNGFNRAFVLMQYMGYLRRNPNDAPDSDYTGFEFWLNKLNTPGANYITAEMVKGFITSTEYRQRVGP
jgi:photosystem II stability/assembly factor-like uncharacterized protein